MDTGIPAFQVNDFEGVLILTPLVDRLTGSNAAWLRQRLLAYLQETSAAQVVINLLNIEYMDRLGVGVLVSLRSYLQPKSQVFLTGLTPEVEAQVPVTRLDSFFPILNVDSPCLLCQGHHCEHLLLWQERLLEFWLVGLTPQEYPREDPLEAYGPVQTARLIPPRQGSAQEVESYVQSETYKHFEQQRQQREGLLRLRDYILVGGLSALFVLGAVGLGWIALNQEWVEAFDESKTSLQRPKQNKHREEVPPLTRDELISRFDRDGDGIFSKDDWVLLNSSEKLFLINQGFQERRLRQGLP